MPGSAAAHGKLKTGTDHNDGCRNPRPPVAGHVGPLAPAAGRPLPFRRSFPVAWRAGYPIARSQAPGQFALPLPGPLIRWLATTSRLLRG